MRQLIPRVKVLNLGRISYKEGLRIQHHSQQSHVSRPDSAEHTLLVLEHDPVYTLGFRKEMPDAEVKKLVEAGAEVIKSDRGGLTTFHGPGQLVAYPVFDLRRFRNLSLRKYVNLLEMSAIHTCRMFGVCAVHGKESVAHTGAWVGDNKICAIGVHCKRFITTHGLALNCNTDLNWFKKIVPCGIPDKGVTNLSKELGKDMTVSAVLPQFLASFQSVFVCSLEEANLEDVPNLAVKSNV